MMDIHSLMLAYLDPGSGSMILQAAIAMIFSAGIFFRRWIGALFAPFTRRWQEQETTPPDSEGTP